MATLPLTFLKLRNLLTASADIVSPDNSSKRYVKEKAQLTVELKNTNILCSTKNYNPSTIDFLKLKKIAKKRYFDPIVLETQVCAMNAWVPFSKNQAYRNIKLFWGDLITIGRGQQGDIAIPSKYNINDLFIIKYPNN